MGKQTQYMPEPVCPMCKGRYVDVRDVGFPANSNAAQVMCPHCDTVYTVWRVVEVVYCTEAAVAS